MNTVLRWIRANVYIVVFVAVMIAAPVGLTILAAGMNSGVREVVKTRAANLSKLKQVEQTKVELSYPVRGSPTLSKQILPNQAFLDRYSEVAAEIERDVKLTSEKALEINRRGRGVLLQELFPETAPHQRETLPLKFYRALFAAYEKLLEDAGTGSPPAAREVQEELDAARERFTNQFLIKGTQEQTDEDRAWLAEQLTNTRLSLYAETARQIKLYAGLDNLDVPRESQTTAKAEGDGLVQLFQWQWDYWVKQDVVEGLAQANASADSVLDAPVKRIISLAVLDQAQAAPAQQSGGGFAPSGGGFGTAGGIGKRAKAPAAGTGAQRGGGSAAPPEGGAPAAPAAPPINKKAQVAPDYQVSFTGRRSNPLYDVVRVKLDLIVDTQRIPEVLDTLGRQNFITVIDLVLDEVDVFAEARAGYYYGPGLVSRLSLVLETVWLREWMWPFMPAGMKSAHLQPAGAGRRSADERAEEEYQEEEEG